MIDLYDIINESEMICEAFKDPRLYQIWQSLQRYKMKWSDLFKWHFNVAWDKIEGNDIEEIDTINEKTVDELFKRIRRVKAGKDDNIFVLFGMKNERIMFVYDAYYGEFGKLEVGHVRWYSQPQNSRYRMTQGESFDEMKRCDYLLLVSVKDKNVTKLINQRHDDKSGAWILTKADHESKHLKKGELGKSGGGRSDYVYGDSFYGMCKKMANEAVEKWKKIVAENSFKKDQDTSKVDSAVEKIMTRLPKACMNATREPEKYSTYDLEKLMKMVYDKYSSSGSGRNYYTTGHDALLVHYQKYCEIVMRMKTGDAYNMASSLEDKKKLERTIFEEVLKIDEALKKFGA